MIYSTLAEAFSNPLIIESPRRAAVAVILRDGSPVSGTLEGHAFPQVLLIQRAPNPIDPWSAHIAFPGGRRDEADRSDIECAIRETREETGLDLSDTVAYQLLGRLNDRLINRSGQIERAVLSAFIFYQVPGIVTAPFYLQPEEVASAFWVSLDYMHQASPTVCEHIIHRKLPSEVGFGGRVTYLVRHFFGLTSLRMPAVDILPFATDRLYVGDRQAPHVFLWGLTLGCLGDVITALDLRRIDWPPALPNGRALGGMIWFLAKLWLILSTIVRRLCRIWR